MTDNVGLSTPRGSGTSGYVQRNLSHLKPRQQPLHRTLGSPYAKPSDLTPIYRQRQPDPEILEHERRRKIEVTVFEERDKLEEEGALDEEEIEEQLEALRRKLTREMEKEGKDAGAAGGRGLKSHQVHELAKAKIEESERLRRALGIREDYEEGGHWKRQEERDRERAAGGSEKGRDKGRD